MIRLLRRHRPQAPPAIRDAPIPLTCATDSRTHLVAVADLDRAIAEHSSLYRTLCGRAVLAAALTAPPGPRCRDCYAPEDGPATGQHDRSGLTAAHRDEARPANAMARGLTVQALAETATVTDAAGLFRGTS